MTDLEYMTPKEKASWRLPEKEGGMEQLLCFWLQPLWPRSKGLGDNGKSHRPVV